MASQGSQIFILHRTIRHCSCLCRSLARIPHIRRGLRRIHPQKTAPEAADGGPSSLGDDAGWCQHLANTIQAKDWYITYNCRIKKLHGDDRNDGDVDGCRQTSRLVIRQSSVPWIHRFLIFLKASTVDHHREPWSSRLLRRLNNGSFTYPGPQLAAGQSGRRQWTGSYCRNEGRSH